MKKISEIWHIWLFLFLMNFVAFLFGMFNSPSLGVNLTFLFLGVLLGGGYVFLYSNIGRKRQGKKSLNPVPVVIGHHLVILASLYFKSNEQFLVWTTLSGFMFSMFLYEYITSKRIEN